MEEVVKRLDYMEGLRDLQRQVVVGRRDVLGSCLLAMEVSLSSHNQPMHMREAISPPIMPQLG